MYKSLLLTLLLLAPVPALADSIPFAFQANGFQSVALINSPLIAPSIDLREPYASLQFGMPGLSGSGVIGFTLSLDGSTESESFAFNCVAGCTVLDGFAAPSAIYHPIPGTLTIDINGQSTEYAFSYATPAPEPGALGLVGVGMTAIIALRRRYCERY